MSEEIVLVAVGQVDPCVSAHLRARMIEAFGRPCRVGHPLPAPQFAYNPRRGQYSAYAILQQLKPDLGEHVLGIVDLDIYVLPVQYVTGLAQERERTALVALPRLRAGNGQEACFLARVTAEARQQLGRTFRGDPDQYIQAVQSLAGRVLGGQPQRTRY